jgi:ferrochelatase
LHKLLIKIDALLVVSFGGPESPPEVMPFLRHVTAGRGVPDERLAEVAAHYAHFAGKSPLPEQVRTLRNAVARDFEEHGIRLPVHVAFRHSRPFVEDTLAELAAHGAERVLAFVTSAQSSYSGCRQYLEDFERARAHVGERAPILEKIRAFFDHPLYIDAVVAHAETALASIGETGSRDAHILFTAHSIPLAMASGCDYEAQLRASMALVQSRLGRERGSLAYQSRSGPPSVPWLTPDVGDELKALGSRGVRDVVVVPIGFVTDHLEVLYDLDVELRDRANALGIRLTRAKTAGTHPGFVTMVRELVMERTTGEPRRFLSSLAMKPDVCVATCCPRDVRGRPT